MTIDELIGRNIRRRRRILGWTQRELGEAIGATFQQIQKYECAANRISAARLWQIAAALGVGVESIYPGKNQTQSSSAQRRQDVELEELITAILQLPPAARAKLMAERPDLASNEIQAVLALSA